MAWDGTNLWIASDGRDRIYKMDTLGNLLDSFPAPNTTATGLCWDGQHLWCADGGTIRIYKLDPATGTILDSIPGPGTQVSCEGLAWMNDTIWNTNWSNNTIWKLDPATGNIWGQFASPGNGSTGLTWDWHDNALWNSDQLTDYIYKINPVTGAVITQFPCPDPEVQDLAFDGTYLWTCGWTSGMVYKMDIGYTGVDELPVSGTVGTFGFVPLANPVCGRSTITYNTSLPGTVSLKVYDSAGRLIETLLEGIEPAGTKSTSWDAKDGGNHAVTNGIYFIRLDAEGKTATQKLVFIR